jgi:hypothetical protein
VVNDLWVAKLWEPDFFISGTFPLFLCSHIFSDPRTLSYLSFLGLLFHKLATIMAESSLTVGSHDRNSVCWLMFDINLHPDGFSGGIVMIDVCHIVSVEGSWACFQCCSVVWFTLFFKKGFPLLNAFWLLLVFAQTWNIHFLVIIGSSLNSFHLN